MCGEIKTFLSRFYSRLSLFITPIFSTTMKPEAIGWAAAFFSALAFGSFGVPIKSGAATHVDIDPLVMQSYKTFMCFITSWLVLLAGEDFHFTPWGIVSGEC